MILRSILLASLIALLIKADFEIMEWTGADYYFPNSTIKSTYIRDGCFIRKNIIVTRAQICGENVFLTMPRLKEGVSATFGTIPLKELCKLEPKIHPFPCWEAQDENNPNSFQSIVDAFADTNGIVWLLDIGVTNTMTSPVRKNNPRVIAYNILTGKCVHKFDLSELVHNASRLQQLAVEYDTNGKAFVYVSDAASRAILVLDIAANRGNKVILPEFVADGYKDVLYLALIRKSCGNNFLVFTYLSGSKVYSVDTDCLRNKQSADRIQDMCPKYWRTVFLGTDGGSALFLRVEGHGVIYRWDCNESKNLNGSLPVYKCPDGYIATQVMPNYSKQLMMVLESNFLDFINGTNGCGTQHRICYMH